MQEDDEDRKPAAIESVKDDEDAYVDDDDWSRQVQTDEIPSSTLILTEDSLRTGSVALDETSGLGSAGNNIHSNHNDNSGSNMALASEEAVPPPPSHPELTLKERLVLRERQRRIETERARLKRQFALSNGGDGSAGGGFGGGSGVDSELDFQGELTSIHDVGSVTERTLGEESTRAHADDESIDQGKLGFNMERFLRNSVTFNPQLESTTEGQPMLMERFLSEPVSVEPEAPMDAPASVAEESAANSFDLEDVVSQPEDVPPDDHPAVPPESFVSFGEDTNGSTNASVVVEADDEDVARDPLTPMASMDAQEVLAATDMLDEPRVLRLTEADMQEMAAIEEASIGNAPPSEREEEMLSEIGELADFGGPIIDPSGNFSQGTPTTAVESASLVSAGNQSARQASSSEHGPVTDAQNLDGFLTQLGEAHAEGLPVLSSAEGSRDGIFSEERMSIEEAVAQMPPASETDDDGRASPILVNRVLRPGLININHHLSDRFGVPQEAVVVDGFDFDKDDPISPQQSTRDDSFRDLPMDAWSPPGKMHVSPISFKARAMPPEDGGFPEFPHMGVESSQLSPIGDVPRTVSAPSPYQKDENTPLLIDVPPELGSSLRDSRRSRRFSVVSIGSIFSDVRSEEDMSKEEIQNESEFYLQSSILSRAFPERMFALTVTLIFEIPVLLMISGGSDALCQLVGRSRYQLLMGFIPLTSAISGNVGLQASTLTTRAISHCHVTPDSYIPWFVHEIGAACVLGAGMGLLLGSIAFFASGMDVPFGLTILFAQFISIVTAGCTGTFAPLLFSFIFRRDSGKWGGPLETAIQDIVGSFAMVIISYHILKFLGPGPIDPSDVCSPGQTDDLA